MSSNLKGTSLLINGSEFYVDGGLNREIKKLPELSGTRQKILLSPGEYQLKAESGKLLFGADPVQETLNVKSGEEIYLSVIESPQSKGLEFKYE